MKVLFESGHGPISGGRYFGNVDACLHEDSPSRGVRVTTVTLLFDTRTQPKDSQKHHQQLSYPARAAVRGLKNRNHAQRRTFHPRSRRPPTETAQARMTGTLMTNATTQSTQSPRPRNIATAEFLALNNGRQRATIVACVSSVR